MAPSGSAEAATVQHFEILRGYRVGTDAAAAKPTTAAPTTISFNAFSRDFTLELEPNGRLAAMQAELGSAPVSAPTAARSRGTADSWVRIVLTPAGPSGLVFDGETLYAIESGNERSRAEHARRADDVSPRRRLLRPGEIGSADGAAAIDGVHASPPSQQNSRRSRRRARR